MMNIGVSGLSAMQKDLDVVAHNVSNVETVGYKNMANVFSDVYVNAYQDRAPALPGFSGVARYRVVQSFAGGTLKNTNNVTDMAIIGRGFFVLQQDSGMQKLTRNGIFHVDKEMNFVDSANDRVQGFLSDEHGRIISNSLNDIKLEPAVIRRVGMPTTDLNSMINLDGTDRIISGWGHQPVKWNLMNETTLSSLPKMAPYEWIGPRMAADEIELQQLSIIGGGVTANVPVVQGDSASTIAQNCNTAFKKLTSGVRAAPIANRVRYTIETPGTPIAADIADLTINGHSKSVQLDMTKDKAAMEIALKNLPNGISAENITVTASGAGGKQVIFELVSSGGEDIETALNTTKVVTISKIETQSVDRNGQIAGVAQSLSTAGDKSYATAAIDLEVSDLIGAVDTSTSGSGNREVVIKQQKIDPPLFNDRLNVAKQELTITLNGEDEKIAVPENASAADVAKLMPDGLKAKAAMTRAQLNFKASPDASPTDELEVRIGAEAPFTIKANQLGPAKNVAALFEPHLPPGVNAIDGGDGETVVIEVPSGENVIIGHEGAPPQFPGPLPLPGPIFEFSIAPIMSDGKPGAAYDMLATNDLKTTVTSYIEAEAHHTIDTIDYVSNVSPDKGGIAPDAVENISIPNYGLPFDSTDPNSFNWSASFNVYDNIGSERELTAYFLKRSEGEWTLKYEMDGDSNKVTPLPPTVKNHVLYFDPSGELDKTITGNTAVLPVEINPGGSIGKTNVALDFSRISQYADDFAVYSSEKNGRAPGQFEYMDIADGGIIKAIYTNGEKVPIAKVAIAVVPNEQDMLSIGNGWEATMESGDPIISAAGIGNAGEVKTNFLEASNVDLLQELVNLVVAQRNYQANTKTLKTSETVVQSLMSIF